MKSWGRKLAVHIAVISNAIVAMWSCSCFHTWDLLLHFLSEVAFFDPVVHQIQGSSLHKGNKGSPPFKIIFWKVKFFLLAD